MSASGSICAPALGKLGIGDQSAESRSATLELGHLDAAEADWSLQAELGGPWPRLALSGTFETARRPGPLMARLAYVDAPGRGVVEGVERGARPLEMRLETAAAVAS